jgi:DNA-binding beta-propeller fold protein YncE
MALWEGDAMRTRLVFCAGIVALAAGFLAAQGMYSQVGDIQIGAGVPPVPAQWDYLNVDSAGKRLYVSHGNAEVVVIDTGTERVVGRISDTPGIHGIAVGSGRLFTSNGRENKVSIVDAKTLQTLSKVDSGGANPDAITFDPKKNEVWVFNHTGKSATEMDSTGKVIATIPLSGTAETGQVDSAAGRVYVNVEDKDVIDVIDTAAKKVIASWSVAPGDGPTGMSLDIPTHRLFVGAGKFMVMMDSTNGKVVASVPICAGTDSTWYDATTKLAFSSCRDGKVTVAHVDAPDKMAFVQTIETSNGSKTMALDTGTHKIYVAAAKPAPGGGRTNDPASFHVLVYGRK